MAREKAQMETNFKKTQAGGKEGGRFVQLRGEKDGKMKKSSKGEKKNKKGTKATGSTLGEDVENRSGGI